MIWGRSVSRAQAATFHPPVLLDHDVPPGFVQKARAGRPPSEKAWQMLPHVTPHRGEGCGWLAFKKQASIAWRSARQLLAEAAPQSAHRRKAGWLVSLPHVPWELRQVPPASVQGGRRLPWCL